MDNIDGIPNRFRIKKKADTRKVVQSAPVSLYCGEPDSGGVLFRHMFPSSGTIDKIVLEVEELNGESAQLVLELKDGDDSYQRLIKAKVGKIVLEDDFSVTAGTKVVISVLSVKPVTKTSLGTGLPVAVAEPSIKGIWISFMYNAGGS
jgi:glycerophosphoryl diester phosphodiesterase